MSQANSILAASNPVGRYLAHALGATPKLKLIDALRQSLRSRRYSRRAEENHYPISPRPFSADLLEDGLDIRTVQEPLRHKDVSTTISVKQYNEKIDNWDFRTTNVQIFKIS